MGSSFNETVKTGKEYFKEVKVFKPKSSRKDSKENFIICKYLRQNFNFLKNHIFIFENIQITALKKSHLQYY